MKIYKKDYNLELNSRPKYTSGVYFGLAWQAIVKRKVMLFSLFFLLVTLPIVYLTFKYQSKTEAAWYDDGWLYRTALTIGNSGSADSNKKVKFDIDTAALYSAGKIQSDCGDSRFTDINGKILKYYIDSAGGACNTNSTDYYVLVPTINSGNTIIYHYYGNPSAANGTQTSQFSEATFSPTSGPTAASEEQSQGPVAYWKFDEGNGSNVYDSTKNSKNGSISEATWQNEDQCISGKCLKFDGTNDEVTFSTPITFIGNGSVEAWMKRTSSSDTVLGAGNSYSEGYWFYIAGPNVYQNWGGSYVNYANLASSFPVNTWYHIALVRSGSTYIIYKNGVQVGSGNGVASTGTLRSLGRLYSGVGSFANNNGFIDEFKVYLYARTAAQIKADYNSRGSTKGAAVQMSSSNKNSDALSNGLVGYWKMDETATPAIDSSGNGNSGTWNGTPTTTAGKFGNSINFDANNDFVTMGNASALNFDNTNSFSTCGWFKRGRTGRIETLVSKQDNDSPNRGWRLMFYDNDTLTFGLYNTVTTNVLRMDTVSTITSTTTWYQYCATYDGSNSPSGIKIYLNGASQDLTINTNSLTGTILTAVSFNIGSRDDGNYLFQGAIDEVRIYNRVLSPAEVRDLYDWAPGPIAYWNMDEKVSGNSKTLNDISGNGNNGTTYWGANNSGMNCTKPGKYGGGCEFDGTDDYINLESPTVFDNIPVKTVSFWTKLDAQVGYGDVGSHWLNKGDSSGGWFIATDPGNSRNIYGQHFGGGNAGRWSFPQFSIGAWHYVTLVYDQTSTSNNPLVYVDAISQTVTEYSTPTGSAGDDSANNLLVSKSPGYNRWVDGSIDEIRIYNYARSQKQIVSDMNAGHPAVGSPVGSAVGYWKFDEGADNTCYGGINDVCNSGSGKTAIDGAISGNTWINDGKYGKALDFDPDKDAMVNLGSNSSLNETNGLTFSTWLYTDAYTESWPSLYQRGGQSSAVGFIWIYQNAGSLMYQYANGASVVAINSGCSLTTNTWQYVTLVHDRDNKKIICYVNGVLKDTDTYADTALTVTTGTAYFGTYQGSASNSYHFNGRMDETKIYNYALTEDEVKLDYNQGKALVLGSLSDTSLLSGGSVASNSASAEYCIPGDTSTCSAPVAEWKMDEKTGQYAQDTSGNGNTGTLGSSSGSDSYDPSWISGKIGGSLRFNGSDDVNSQYIQGTAFQLSDTYTMSLWFKPERITGLDGGWQPILEMGNVAGSRLMLWLENDEIGAIGHKESAYSKTTTANFTSGVWYQMVYSFNYSSNPQARIFINGIEHTLSNNSGIGHTPTFSNNFRVGTDSIYPSSYYSFQGVVDQVRFYNYTRTPAQITWDYNRGKPVAWWKIDENQGVTAYDTSGNNNNGSFGGDVSYVSGKFNYAATFDGRGDYINMGDPTSGVLDFGANQDLTVSSWFYLNSLPGTWASIINKGGSGSIGYGMEISGSNYFTCSIQGSGGSNQHVSATSTPATGTWLHGVCVFDRDGNVTGYVNGQQVLQSSITGNSGSLANSYNFSLGSFGDNGQFFFSGKIDDARVYNYALTTTQIKSLYNENSVLRFGPITGSPQ